MCLGKVASFHSEGRHGELSRFAGGTLWENVRVTTLFVLVLIVEPYGNHQRDKKNNQGHYVVIYLGKRT
jgi:hypothetical protein